MKEQAELPDMSGITNHEERREIVYKDLVEFAEVSQKDIKGLLDRYHIDYKTYYLVNGLDIKGGPGIQLFLAGRPDVDRVLASPYLRPLPDKKPVQKGTIEHPSDDMLWNQELVRADMVWNALAITGRGVVVGQSDTGVQGDHPELTDSYRGEPGDNEYDWYDPWYGSEYPQDPYSHGTHTLGTVLGNNVGIAPDAEWIGCVNLARNLGNPAYYLECMQFMLAPFPQKGNVLIDGKPEL